MRGVIDATALGTGRGGDETMLTGMVLGLGAAAGRNDSFTVLCDDPGTAERDLGHPALQFEKMTRRPGPVHFAADLPLYLKKHRSRFDVVLTITHAPLTSPVPVAHMVQDLSFLHLPDAYPLATKLRLKTLLALQVRKAQTVLTLSEFCRNDLIDSYDLDPSRVRVVPCTVQKLQPLSDARRGRALRSLERNGVEPPFLLYLGNLHPRKNVARTIRTFTQARRKFPELGGHKLVIAGGSWWGGGGEEAEAAAAPEGSILLLGRVDDDVRQVLLETADALLYLSLFEGFGLPPLEAMASSTPVLASNATAIPEVTGGAALLVDPRDDAAITDAIGKVATDEALRKELVERGSVRVEAFRPEITGSAVVEALSAVAQRPPVPWGK